jgi:excinuclease ABC subunit C
VSDRVKAQLEALPKGPGVYLFRGDDGAVLYVGKAKSLRSRVRSYFQKTAGRARLGSAQLVGRIRDIETIVAGTEAQALHLEQSLVKRHRPPFNIRLRDDKSFPYIAVTVEDEYPRVMFTRERHRRGVVYFGPYANAKKVRETLDVLNRAFRFRPCEGPRPGRHSGIPCLDYHIDRCLAPCVGKVSPEDYRKIIDGVIDFLSGDTKTIDRRLEAEMAAAAAEERFEDAARYRNRLFSVRHLAERQATPQGRADTIDVIGLAVDDDCAAAQVFPLRDGKLVDRYSFHLENVAGQDLQTIAEEFCLGYYSSAPSIPPEVVLPREVGNLAALEELLSERRGSRVVVRPAFRGDKRRLAELATKNAELALVSAAAATERQKLRRVAALEELREALNLESLPVRIECFDISTTQGRQTVGSMAVFQDAQPRKALYRKFAVRRPAGHQDDYAALAEVLSRRFARAGVLSSAPDWDESFASIPNLVVVDGGRGQLSAALKAMHEYELPRVAVVSLAKREEHVYVPGQRRPMVLDRSSAGLQLLQRIRDEAHRFAVGYHRQKRSAEARDSLLDHLRGVGPVRRRALLNHFGSVERILAASQEELEGVPGLPEKTARAVYAQLHKAGPTVSNPG